MNKEQIIKKLKDMGILAAIGDPISIQDTDFKILFQNESHKSIIGDQVGEYCYKAIHGRDQMCESCHLDACFKDGKTHTLEQSRTTNEGVMYAEITASPLKTSTGEIVAGVEVVRDITRRKQAEEELQKNHDELEKRVKERTVELEEMNTALKVLLQKRENDRRELEENVLNNIKNLILPYIAKLKRNKSMSHEMSYLNIIEINLNEIVSPFALRLSSKYLGLTPKEIQIANLIKEGRQDKDIIEMLHISLETVKAHRKNIRKKLNIYGKRINLRTKLLSLD